MRQYFYKTVALVCLFIASQAYGLQTQVLETSLLLNSISVDDSNPDDIKQIVFTFNQNVAILGAVPSQKQIDSVTMSHGLSESCRWRFVKLNMLACELGEALPSFVKVDISLEDSFSGLKQQVDLPNSKVSAKTITTSLPKMRLQTSKKTNDFPSSFVINFYTDNNLQNWPRQLALHKEMLSALRLKTPNGDYKKLDYLIERERKGYARSKITISPETEQLQNGLYQIIIPQGFTPGSNEKPNSVNQYRTLANDEVVYEFKYSRDFEFYGVACKLKDQSYDFIKPQYDNLLKCPPERLSFVFSRKLHTPITNGNWRPDWLQGPEYTRAEFTEKNNSYYYGFELQGNGEYVLRLADIKSDEGNALTQQDPISFVTPEATSEWYLRPGQLDVVESDRDTSIYFARRNVADMQRSLVAIKSAQDLQRYLNRIGKDTNPKEERKFASSEETRNKAGLQATGFRQALSEQASGLVEVSLRGSHSNYAVEYSDNGLPILKTPIDIKKDSFIANSAAFNLAVWHHSNLLVQAIDWEANNLANANVSLVCEGKQAPLHIGYTSDEGLLFVPASRWSSLYENDSTQACWLWANTEKGNAAIQLLEPEASILSKPKMIAFTAQPIYEPGDTVHIGIVAKKRIENANGDGTNHLLPMKNIDDYFVQIMRPDSDEVHTQLDMSALTKNGLTSASFIINDTDNVGSYPIVIRSKLSNEETDYLGSVIVQEFTPPEFEFSIELAQKIPNSSNIQPRINMGEVLKASVSARRLNGGNLVNAKVSTHYHMSRRYENPQTWPQDYVFTSYDEFKRNDEELKKTKSFTLDESGILHFESAPIQSKLPIADIVFESTVTADDGETQSSQDRVLYLSRNHYIGTKISEDGEHLALIGIDKNGQPLNDIAVVVEFSKPDPDRRGQWIKLDACKLDSLPRRCKVPILGTQLKAKITSGKHEYQWIRSVYANGRKAPLVKVDYPNINFAVVDSQNNENSDSPMSMPIPAMWDGQSIPAKVGEALNVNLSSNVTGTATFIVVAGNIQKVWQQSVTVGENTIVLPIEQAWIPSAKVMVSLSVDRKVTDAIANALLQDLAPGLEKRSPTSEFLTNRQSSDLGQFRLLSASINLAVSPQQAAPEVTIVPESEQVLAGSELSISLQSNTEVETQLWLVNDGILAMAGFDIESIDPASFYFYEAQLDNRLGLQSLSQRLLTENSLLQDSATNKVQYNRLRNMFSSETEGISVTGSRAFMESEGLSQGASFTKKDFAQSLWLDKVNLKPNNPQTITIKLPQLIGRWKIIAMNLTKHQSSMSSANVATVRNVEYFLDSPTAIFDNDNSHVAITKINNTDQAIEDELTLWIDGKIVKREKVKLGKAGAKEAYSRVQIDLPSLLPGKHTIHITSRVDENFAAYAELMVLPVNITKQTAWLVGANNSSLIPPQDMLANSLSLSAAAGGGDTPNWQQITQYNQDYPHMCWEQTISRAVSYAYSHNAKTDWPQGEVELNSLLKKQAEYTNGLGQYSYFPNTPDDAFLTAYTFLAHAWLKDSGTPLSLNVEIAADTLREYLTLSQDNKVSKLDRSMALLALAKNKSISLEEALAMRQEIGTSDQGDSANSLVLQALALKLLGANTSLYEGMLRATTNNKYIDTNTSVFNQNSYKCFAALAFDNDSEERVSLLSEVVNQQQQKGHFGSTFANAVCSYLLQENTAEVPATELAFSFAKDELDYQYVSDSNYWLRLRYMQNIESIAPASAGLSISRAITVKRGDEWIDIDESSLVIGDLIKTEIVVDSPIARQHIAITDSIAGGFEAINPSQQSSRYSDYFDYSWFRFNAVQIRNGKAFWYINRLLQGHNSFVYFSRVRHAGEFTIAPVNAEAMYRTDVYGNSQSKRITIK